MENIVLIPFIIPFIVGAVVGSFLNVVILRHGKQEGVASGRSQCPSCKKVLHWYELIPIISYLLQWGRCRGCGARISPQYPLVELITGVVFFLVWTTHQPFGGSLLTSTHLLLALVMWCLLIVITIYDARTMLIPNVFSYPYAALAFIMAIMVGNGSSVPFLSSLIATSLSGPIVALPLYLLFAVSRGKWMGLGDVKLALGMGWMLGIVGGLSALMFSFWIGAIVSLTIMTLQWLSARMRVSFVQATTRPFTLTSEIPFGPYLVLGTATVYFVQITFQALF